MFKYFDKTFFSFLTGFVALIVVSFFIFYGIYFYKTTIIGEDIKVEATVNQ